MKKIMTVLLLVLFVTACSSKPNYNAIAKEYLQEGEYQANISVANLLKTSDGRVMFDNLGYVEKNGVELELDIKVPSGEEYEDLRAEVNGDEVTVGEKVMSYEEFQKTYIVPDYRELFNLIVEDEAEAEITKEKDKYHYKFNFDSSFIDRYLSFSNFEILDQYDLKDGSVTHTVIIEDNEIERQEIFIDMELISQEGDAKLTQSIVISED